MQVRKKINMKSVLHKYIIAIKRSRICIFKKSNSLQT